MRLLLVLLTGCFVTKTELHEALDRDGDGYLPVQTGGDDCDEGRADVNPGAVELCGDGIDNDCDGVPDDDGVGAQIWFLDDDGDGYGIESTTSACTEPQGYAPQAGDCDDADPAINPGVDDLCDGIDQDCDGVPDDEVPLVERYRDADGDGIGTDEEVVLACTDVPGFVNIAGDCDDTDPTISPVAVDLCDGIDQDCDGVVDDDAVFTQVYRDADGDGIGTDLDTLTDCGAVAGYVPVGGDCDDTDPTISPVAVDLCDGIDQDCDGVIDDDAVLTLYFEDLDGDGVGNPDVAVETCGSVPGFVPAGGDCDDTDASIRPGSVDPCDGVDQNCDGIIDDGASFLTWYLDNDGDGLGDSSVSLATCDGIPAGFVAAAGDCDDTDGLVTIPAWYADEDGDGFGGDTIAFACSEPPDHSSVDGDCDDSSASRYPGNPEVCNSGVDEDCDPNSRCRFAGILTPEGADVVLAFPASGTLVMVVEDVVGSAYTDLAILVPNRDRTEVFSGPVASLDSPDAILDYKCGALSVADFDGDGLSDLACDGALNGFAIYLADGNGGFVRSMTVSGLVNGLVVQPTSPLGPGVWIGNDTSVLFFPYQAGSYSASTAAVTVTGAGVPGAVPSCGMAFPCLAIRDTSAVRLYTPLAAGTYSAADALWSVPLQSPGQGALYVDAVEVGYPSLVFPDGSEVWTIDETSVGLPSAFMLSADVVGLGPAAVPLADIDGDGFLEWRGESTIEIIVDGVPVQSFVYQLHYGGPDGLSPVPEAVFTQRLLPLTKEIDWNGDGLADLLVRTPQDLRVYFGRSF